MGRKRDIRLVDRLCAGMDPDDEYAFRDYIHECKDSGRGGTDPKGDFTWEELLELKAEFLDHRGLGNGHD